MQNPFRNRMNDDDTAWRDQADRGYRAEREESRSWRQDDGRSDYRARDHSYGQQRDQGRDRDSYASQSDWRAQDQGRDYSTRDYGSGYADYGRSDQGSRGQDWGGSRYASDANRDYGRRDDYRSSGYAPGAGVRSDRDQGRGQQWSIDRSHDRHDHDPDYLHWREKQMQNLDHDYSAWRDERRQKFSSDFDTWRQSKPRDEHGRIRTQAENPIVGEISEGNDGPMEKSPLMNRDRKS